MVNSSRSSVGQKGLSAKLPSSAARGPAGCTASASADGGSAIGEDCSKPSWPTRVPGGRRRSCSAPRISMAPAASSATPRQKETLRSSGSGQLVISSSAAIT